MENLNAAVRNIRSKSRKVRYNPFTGTNWCHLPMEMRMECMKHMEFMTRIRLRATATTEKALVESKKMPFSKVFLKHHESTSTITMEITSGNRGLQAEFADSCPLSRLLLDHVLRFGDIDSFEFLTDVMDPSDVVEELVHVIDRNKPLRFESLVLDCEIRPMSLKILKSCDHVQRIKMEHIQCDAEGDLEMGEVIAIPSVANARHIAVTCGANEESVTDIVRKWIEIDAEVGRTLVFSRLFNFEFNLDTFMEDFPGRSVSQTDETARFRTDNEAKHVLVKLVDRRSIKMLGIIIPADVPEAEEQEWLIRTGDPDEVLLWLQHIVFGRSLSEYF